MKIELKKANEKNVGIANKFLTMLIKDEQQYDENIKNDFEMKVLKDDEDGKVIFEKLKKLSPKLLLKKEIDELKNSDKNGFRANSLFIQIDATDLLNNI